MTSTIQKFCFALFCILWFVLMLSFPSSAYGRNIYDGELAVIRVLLSSSSSSYTITLKSGDFDLVSNDDRDDVFASLSAGDSLTFSYSDGTYHVLLGEEKYDSADPFFVMPTEENTLFTFSSRSYRGGFKLMKTSSASYAVNELDVEQYLYGVIGQELGYGLDQDAMMAQAVASRSYAISHISSNNRNYDVTNTVSSQCYGGYTAEGDSTRQAVNATRGQVIMYDGKVVEAFYSSNHGGYSEDIEKVWASDAVPIKGVPSPYDKEAGNYSSYGASTYSWTVTYTPDQLVSLANRYGRTNIGEFEKITMSQTFNGQTSVSGRAMIVTITGTNGSVTATKDNIRSLLNLKSTLISINSRGGSAQKIYIKGLNGVTTWSVFDECYAIAKNLATSVIGGDRSDSFYVRTANGIDTISKTGEIVGDEIVITGRGFGHGIGMSQWGAIAMADHGYTWREIIEHYYCSGGLEIEELY